MSSSVALLTQAAISQALFLQPGDRPPINNLKTKPNVMTGLSAIREVIRSTYRDRMLAR